MDSVAGINPGDLRRLITHILQEIGLYSEAAVALLLGTAAVESVNGRNIYQLAGGPARGIFQMEPTTEVDIWTNYLRYHGRLSGKITAVTGRHGPGPWLTWDLAYQIAMARVHYLRVPTYLPDPKDIAAQAIYWKIYYNTLDGAGHPTDYLHRTRRLIPA